MMGRGIEALCTLCAYSRQDINPQDLYVWPQMLTGILPCLLVGHTLNRPCQTFREINDGTSWG